MKATGKGIKRIINAFGYSFFGFKETFKSEKAFRQDLFFCVISMAIAFLSPITTYEKLAIFLSLVFILLMELINTAIETVIDRISEDFHVLSKKAKDIGSLLVLVSFICFFVTVFTIIFNYFH